jgi:hypothetical protein
MSELSGFLPEKNEWGTKKEKKFKVEITPLALDGF